VIRDCVEERVMRKLKIDMGELDMVWEVDAEAFDTYLDRETAKIITVTSETKEYLQEFDEEYQGEGAEEDAGAQAFADWLAQPDCPESEREEAMAAYALEWGASDRYLGCRADREGFRDVEDSSSV
jgi:hypothetical protein